MTHMTPAAPKPITQKPGAGLPFVEQILLRYVLFPMACRKIDWGMADRMFASETAKILALVETISPEDFIRPVLVERVRGMEDSSRHWSVAQTLDHLVIVGKGMGQVIESLSDEKPWPHAIGTADVKPPAQTREDMLLVFKETMQNLGIKMSTIPNRNSKTTHAHPWFGGLNTHQWHVVMGLHQRTHRTQIERIVAGLSATA